MKRYIHEMKEVIKTYENSFEFVFTNDFEVASRYFYTKTFPDVMPFVCIVDKSRKLHIQESNNPDNITEAIKTEVPEGAKFHYFQTVSPIFINSLKQDFQEALSKFIDKQAKISLNFEKWSNKTFVKKICGQIFWREILLNKNVKECVIEIFKHDCPSCAYNGKVFNVFTQKLNKYGLDLPCFRLSIDNKVPYLGSFPYSPMYFYVKKNPEGKI